VTTEEPRRVSPKVSPLGDWFELDALLDKIDTLRLSILEFKRACQEFDAKIEKAQWPRFPVVTTAYFWADLQVILEDPSKLNTKLAKLKEEFHRAYSEYRTFFSQYEDLRRSLSSSSEVPEHIAAQRSTKLGGS
jgi:hypothetical protein